MGSRLHLCVVLAVGVGAATVARAQVIDPGSTFRVFLNSGQALESFGESALVGDRLIFTLVIGEAGKRSALQLMSVPVTAVDMPRTTRYAESMRAAHYAASRGETDYAAITAEVERAVSQLTQVDDPKRRLALAEEAKRRLLTWSRDNYSYRANDIHELAGAFDEVIAELRAAAGASQFTVDLMSGPLKPDFEPRLPAPTLRESIALALVAARAADLGSERLAVLRAAAAALGDVPEAGGLRDDLRRRLDAELAADGAYAALAAGMLARADAAQRRGDVGAVSDTRTEAVERDRQLGSLRPGELFTLLAQLDAKLEAARVYRLALDHHAFARRSRLDYERQVRPVMSGLDGVRPVLEALRDMRGTAYERLALTHERLTRFAAEIGRLKPPADLSDVHATLVSAVRLALEACERRRLAVISANITYAREASSAAAGALLLAAQARDTLVGRLYPPKIQ